MVRVSGKLGTLHDAASINDDNGGSMTQRMVRVAVLNDGEQWTVLGGDEVVSILSIPENDILDGQGLDTMMGVKETWTSYEVVRIVPPANAPIHDDDWYSL